MTGRGRYTRRQRLGRREIEGLLASGRSLRGAGITIRMLPNALGWPRLGLIVPGRQLPRAVDRNRVKRVVREWFRTHQRELGSRDILVRLTAKPSGPAATLREDLGNLLSRLS